MPGLSARSVFFSHTPSRHGSQVSLQREVQQYKPSLAHIDTLLTELKHLDHLTELKHLDHKMILTEVHLLESRVYRGISNFAKAKAALTSARIAANAIYRPPALQSVLDLQSGILHAEIKITPPREDGAALGATKYMLLCKVMLNLNSSDPTIHSHLAALYDNLLKQNLLHIMESYLVVEIEHVAQEVGQGRQAVEANHIAPFHMGLTLFPVPLVPFEQLLGVT
ncbi:hypothetical protein FPV67DRAFT_1725585 [Lyophyllum atratum]|nr:hypothetical protein FPV67DRAFT_1725585 [Lyophyllum atratum]